MTSLISELAYYHGEHIISDYYQRAGDNVEVEMRHVSSGVVSSPHTSQPFRKPSTDTNHGLHLV